MSNPYIGKLAPTVGNGLGGLPRRAEATTTEVETPRGEEIFTSTNSAWVVPDDVYSVCAVAVGGGAGGGGAYTTYDYGGDGGSLSWANKIAVTPGETIVVTVGNGGSRGYSFARPGSGGTSSVSIGGTIVLKASGGARYADSANDDRIAHGGGLGGTGGLGGGGGAGGYSGAGGGGGTQSSGSAGSGGGGGGGGSASGYGGGGWAGAGGGGVGLLGEGSSGAGGSGGGSTKGYGGSGGSGGNNGTDNSKTTSNDGHGALYGGAGGYGGLYASDSHGSTGGKGAVRLVWGEGRVFPSTDVGAT